MKHTIMAYCWASGLIEFGEALPEGALPIVTGNAVRVRETVTVLARHAYNNKDLLVPGIPEAASQNEARVALVRFCRLVREHCTHPNKWRKSDEQ